MPTSNKLADILTSVRNEGKTGRILASLGTAGSIRSVAISVKDGKVIDVSDSKAGQKETGFWNLPIRNAFFVPRANFDDVELGGGVVEMSILLKLLHEGGELPAQLVPATYSKPPAASNPSPGPAIPGAAPTTGQARAARPHILWELSKKIDELIASKGLDRARIRGKIGLAAGVFMDIDEHTPDDDLTIQNVLKAANSILGAAITLPGSGNKGRGGNSLKTALESIDRAIKKKGLDPAKTKGKISLKSGVFLEFDDNPPDDIQVANQILAAAREVLGEVL